MGLLAAQPRSAVQGNEEPLSGAVAASGAVTQTLSGERPAGLRTTRAEPFQARTAPSVRQGLVAPRKQTAKYGAELVKFGGDSGAVQQVSDIGGVLERVPFQARSRACHEIDVKREIISPPLRRGGGGPAQAVSWRGERARPVCAECVGSSAYSRGFSRMSGADPASHGERGPALAVLIRDARAPRHF